MTESLNILNVNATIDPVYGGGTAERTVQLSKACSLSGHNVTVLSLSSRYSQTAACSLSKAGVEVVLLNTVSERFFFPFPFHKKIKNAVRVSDIVHIMGHWTLINFLVCFYCRLYNKPYVFCPAGALPIFGRSKFIKKIYNLLFGHMVIARASGYIAITPDELSSFRDSGVVDTNVRVIPNAVWLDEYDVDNEEASKIDQFKPYILFLGRLNEIKGPDLLLSAFISVAENYPEINLVFAGPDGGLEKYLKDEVLKADIGRRVFFIGHVAGAAKHDFYRHSLFLAIPSRQEAMSLVAIEAGACSAPVLLTDVCGFDVSSFEGGLVVKPSVKALAEGLELMLSNANLKNMGINMHSFISENYTWPIVTKKLLIFYKEILLKG